MKDEIQESEPPLSEMEEIRLKAVSPEFLKECEVATKKFQEHMRRDDYEDLLIERAALIVEERNKAREGFEWYCRNYKPEYDDDEGIYIE